jgi:undecaprenyl-diphosphatase
MSAPPNAIDLTSALGLGVLQGIAEFLPISSSGHLAVAQAWLGIRADQGGHTFNIVLHAGTLLAVGWTYRRDLAAMVFALFAPARYPPAFRYGMRIFGATLPLAVVLADPIQNFVIAAENNLRGIAAAFLTTATLLTLGHYRARGENRHPAPDPEFVPTWRQAMIVGLVQLVAVLPGISRAGSTLAAGLMTGLSRSEAARFSFLLSVPAVLGATLSEVRHVFAYGAVESTLSLKIAAAGLLTSFIVGLLTLKALIGILTRIGPLPFVPYLVLLSGLTYYLAGW